MLGVSRRCTGENDPVELARTIAPPWCSSTGVLSVVRAPRGEGAWMSINAMQLTKGGWMRVAAPSSARAIVNQGKVVRPSQLIARVRPAKRGSSTS